MGSVRLVEGVEKCENKKCEGDRKVEGLKKFSFLSFVFGWEDEKSGGMENLFIWLRRKMKE